MPAHCHSRYQHHTYSEQHQDSSQPLVTCEESWPWDDLLDSPGSDSFQSASTTYDPPSVDSVPTSFVSSTGMLWITAPSHCAMPCHCNRQHSSAVLSYAPVVIPCPSGHDLAGSDQALLAPRLCNQLSCNTCQAAVQAESVIGASALPILVPKEASNSAVGYRQLGEASELRRVPRPRFRLANQRPTATRRSLLDDFDSVEDVCDDGSMHDDDYSCSVSSLIKAHVEPSYHQHQFQQPQQQLREWCLRRHSSHAGHQVQPNTLHRCMNTLHLSMDYAQHPIKPVVSVYNLTEEHTQVNVGQHVNEWVMPMLIKLANPDAMHPIVLYSRNFLLQDGKFFAPVSHPVSFSDLDRQDSEASTDVVVAMGGMSIKKASQQNKQHHAPRSKSLQTTSSESGNADSMFAWLSRLLPGL